MIFIGIRLPTCFKKRPWNATNSVEMCQFCAVGGIVNAVGAELNRIAVGCVGRHLPMWKSHHILSMKKGGREAALGAQISMSVVLIVDGPQFSRQEMVWRPRP